MKEWKESYDIHNDDDYVDALTEFFQLILTIIIICDVI